MAEFEDVLGKLDKKTRQKFKLASEITIEKLPTASFGINLMLGGGIDLGKQTTMWGGEQAGKSGFWLQTIAKAQALGKVCAYFDAERTFDPKWATRLGVDKDRLWVPRINSIGDFTDAGMDFIRAGGDLIVVDSTSALMPRMFWDEHGNVKSFDDAKQMGRFSAEIGQSSRMILGENTDAALVHLSQVRMDVGAGGPAGTPQKAHQGKEVGHLDSLRLRISTGKSANYVIKEKVQYGDNLFEELVGQKVSWSVDKNKMNGKLWVGSYNFMKQGDVVGVDAVSELIEWGKRYGAIEGSTWLNIYGESLQGSGKAIKYLNENPEVRDKLEADIFARAE